MTGRHGRKISKNKVPCVLLQDTPLVVLSAAPVVGPAAAGSLPASAGEEGQGRGDELSNGMSEQLARVLSVFHVHVWAFEWEPARLMPSSSAGDPGGMVRRQDVN